MKESIWGKGFKIDVEEVEAEEQKREKKHKNKKRRKSTSIKGTDTQFALGPKTTRRPRPMLWSTPIFMTPLQQTLGGTVRCWCWCDSPRTQLTASRKDISTISTNFLQKSSTDLPQKAYICKSIFCYARTKSKQKAASPANTKMKCSRLEILEQCRGSE